MRPMMRNSDSKRSNEQPEGNENLKLNLPPKKVDLCLLTNPFGSRKKKILLRVIQSMSFPVNIGNVNVNKTGLPVQTFSKGILP